jgi:hypothetical protein
MENHQGTVTGRGNGGTPACPAFADLLAEQVLWQARATSRRQAKRFSARRREDPESFTVLRYHPLSVSF